jgi:hypothetical protein
LRRGLTTPSNPLEVVGLILSTTVAIAQPDSRNPLFVRKTGRRDLGFRFPLLLERDRMSDWNTGQGPSMQILDWVFSRLGGNNTAPPPEVVERPAGEMAEISPPPRALASEADLQAANAWLQRERMRLESYTRSQLGRLQHEHQNLVAQTYHNEQTIIARAQELSRTEEMLATQSRALQQQAEELGKREQALAEQLQEWVQGEEKLEEQGGLLEALEAETAALLKSREAARADLEALAVSLMDRRKERAQEQALFASRLAELETRLQEADRAEAAAQRRLAEVEELEARLLHEIEAEKRQRPHGFQRTSTALPRRTESHSR